MNVAARLTPLSAITLAVVCGSGITGVLRVLRDHHVRREVRDVGGDLVDHVLVDRAPWVTCEPAFRRWWRV
jgi:hypothetical protein